MITYLKNLIAIIVTSAILAFPTILTITLAAGNLETSLATATWYALLAYVLARRIEV